MKIASSRMLDVTLAKPAAAVTDGADLKPRAAKIVVVPKHLPPVIANKTLEPSAKSSVEEKLKGITAPEKNESHGGLKISGIASHVEGGILRGADRDYIPGNGKRDDFWSGGFRFTNPAGGNVNEYGIGSNKRQGGAGNGNAWGGSITTPGGATESSNSSGGAGRPGGTTGTPEDSDSSRGTREREGSGNAGGSKSGMGWGVLQGEIHKSVVEQSHNGDDKARAERQADVAATFVPTVHGHHKTESKENDRPAEQKKENDTTPKNTEKNNQASKPNPYAMPNPEDSGGGSPRSNVYATPNPEDGGGTPRSSDILLGADLYKPNPEDSGGGTPRSNTANLALKTIAMTKLR